MLRLRMLLAVSVVTALTATMAVVPALGGTEDDSVGVVDQTSGLWYLRDPGNAATTSFYFGNPGDFPIMGDWDCDGIDTPGLYRQSDGFVYLRNSNTQGVADIRFFFGDPGDIPLVGDFSGNGCDTVSIYRPSNQTFYIINALGQNDGGLGAADYSFVFGNPGDKPFAGDLDGDGIDEVGLHRETTGFVYYRNTLTTGNADNTFFYGDPGDQIIAGDWAQKPPNGTDTVGIFRPSNGFFYLRFTNSQGNADVSFPYGNSNMAAVAGAFGALPGGDAPPPGATPPPTTPPPTIPPEQPFTFGDGTWIVGVEILPGTYRTASSPDRCYGARLSGFGGTLDEIIANELQLHPIIVTIEPTDVGFESIDCDLWTNDMTPRTSSPTSGFSDGYWQVGPEVAPGLWRNSDSSESCYWERLSGFSWEFSDIITNGLSTSIQTVRINPGDLGFHAWDCGTWTYLGS
jgi:hypothetical protein